MKLLRSSAGDRTGRVGTTYLGPPFREISSRLCPDRTCAVEQELGSIPASSNHHLARASGFAGPGGSTTSSARPPSASPTNASPPPGIAGPSPSIGSTSRASATELGVQACTILKSDFSSTGINKALPFAEAAAEKAADWRPVAKNLGYLSKRSPGDPATDQSVSDAQAVADACKNLAGIPIYID